MQATGAFKVIQWNPDFSNPRFPEPPDISNQTLFPLDLLHSSSVISPPNDAHLNNLRKSTRNISQIIDQSFSVANLQQVNTNYFSKLSERYSILSTFCL